MKRAHVLFAAGLFAVALTQSLPAADSTLPLGKNGQPLNLDFETGDLRDWQTMGNAFDGQPIRGDTVRPRRRSTGHPTAKPSSSSVEVAGSGTSMRRPERGE